MKKISKKNNKDTKYYIAIDDIKQDNWRYLDSCDICKLQITPRNLKYENYLVCFENKKEANEFVDNQLGHPGIWREFICGVAVVDTRNLEWEPRGGDYGE